MRRKIHLISQDGKIEALRTRIHDLTHDHNNNEEEQEQRQQLSGLLETHQTTEAHLKQLLHHIAALQVCSVGSAVCCVSAACCSIQGV